MSMAFAALRLPERGWEVMHIWEISVSPEVQTISKNRNSDGWKGLYEPMRQDFILRQTFQKTKTYILVGSCGWSVALLEATTHWLEESQYIWKWNRLAISTWGSPNTHVGGYEKIRFVQLAQIGKGCVVGPRGWVGIVLGGGVGVHIPWTFSYVKGDESWIRANRQKRLKKADCISEGRSGRKFFSRRS